MDALDSVSTPQPRFSTAAVAQILAEQFGLSGKLDSLISERDQNFRLDCDDGRRFVFKIANGAETTVTTDFQVQALLHLEQQRCPVDVPRIQRTLGGAASLLLENGNATHVCRTVSFIEGTPLSALRTCPPLALQFGRAAAALDLALAGFAHAGENPALAWDLQRASELGPVLQFVEDGDLRAALAASLDAFDRRVAPSLDALRRQVIHGDLNADNVLARRDDHSAVAGVIDFGDMLRAPLVMELAIAAAYLRTAGDDPVHLIAPFVAGYNAVIPLQDKEFELLYDLVRARLATTIAMGHWRLAERADAYARHHATGESDAGPFLQRLTGVGREPFTGALRDACGP